MGAIDDTRKVIQDLVAPDLKEIKAVIQGNDTASKLRDEALSSKIGAVDERLSAKIDAVEDRLSAKIDAVDDRLSAKMDDQFEILSMKMEAIGFKMESITSRMDANHLAILDALNIHKRLEVVEAKTDQAAKSQ